MASVYWLYDFQCLRARATEYTNACHGRMIEKKLLRAASRQQKGDL